MMILSAGGGRASEPRKPSQDTHPSPENSNYVLARHNGDNGMQPRTPLRLMWPNQHRARVDVTR